MHFPPAEAMTLAAIDAREPEEQIVTIGRSSGRSSMKARTIRYGMWRAALDVPLVALALLADVEDLDRPVRGEPLELVDVDRLDLLARVGVREIAAEIEEADGAEALRGRLRVLGGFRVDRHRLVGGEDERSFRRERRAREWDVERAVDVARDELARSRTSSTEPPSGESTVPSGS